MAFVSVENPSSPNTSPIITIYGVPQLDPVPPGYIGQIDDSDPRITTFNTQMSAIFTKQN